MFMIYESLSKFIIQAKEGSLKTAEYPKDCLDLKMKVSFGQGALARVPWISFTAPEMSASNGYFPVYLFYKEQNILIKGILLSRLFNRLRPLPKSITG